MTLTVLLTRPAAQSKRFAADLAGQVSADLNIIISPLIEIEFLPATMPTRGALILTSANGVKAAKAQGYVPGTMAWCVGPQTAALARQLGYDAMQGPGDASGLVKAILNDPPKDTLIHVRGRHSRGDICAQLSAGGLHCQEVLAYDQKAKHLNDQARYALIGNSPVVLPLFSPRTATILKNEIALAPQHHLVVISGAVAAALGDANIGSLTIAERPDADAMLDSTAQVVKGLRL